MLLKVLGVVTTIILGAGTFGAGSASSFLILEPKVPAKLQKD